MIKLKYKTSAGWREYVNSPAFVRFFIEANYGILFTDFELGR